MGLAKQLSEDSSLTQTGQSVGTPYYMAPEQARGASDEIDVRTDIYGLGGTLFHLVTGRIPFSGDTAAVIMAQHLTAPQPKANQVNPSVSKACSELIFRMLHKKREQRPQSPAELITLIDKVLSGEESTASRPRRTIHRDSTDPNAPESIRFKAQPSSLPLALALGAAALVGVLAFVLLRSNPQTGQPSAQPISSGPAKPSAKTFDGFGAKPAEIAEVSESITSLNTPEKPVRPEPGVLGSPLPALTETMPVVVPSTAPDSKSVASSVTKDPPVQTTSVDLAALDPRAAEVLAAKALESFCGVLKATAPLAAQGKYDDVLALLNRKIGDPSLGSMLGLLQQEKADIVSTQALRRQTVDALRQMSGKPVTLRKGNLAFTGKIMDDAKRDSVTLKVDNGPELSLGADQLSAQDVDAFAPQAADAEALRRRGLLFLAAGDKEGLAKAKEYFIKARDAGLGVGAAPYLERIEVSERGEVEVAADKAWLKAEALFDDKNYKEAAEAYEAYTQKYSTTKSVASRAKTLSDRLVEIGKFFKPEITFRAKDSMSLFAAGFKQRQFPAQESDDPLAPFKNKPAYFNQKTGTAVVYEVRSMRPLSHLRWKGAAMQNMLIEVLDANGKVLSSSGPHQGGNRWAEFTLDFDPLKQFTLRFRNYVSEWYLISELELK